MTTHKLIRIFAKAHAHGGKTAERRIDAVVRMLDERGVKGAAEKLPVNVFKLFKIDQKFSISESRLRVEMLQLQRLLHPDRFFDQDQDSRAKSEYLSALVNESYETLRQPYKRAKYLLSLATGQSAEQIERRLDGLKMDASFLARMMDTRERIDSPRPLERAEAARLATVLQAEIEQLNSQLDADFARAAPDLDSVLSKLGKLKFLANCLASLEAKWGDILD